MKFPLINLLINQSSSSLSDPVTIISGKIAAVPRINAKIVDSMWFDGRLITRKLEC